MVSPFAQTGKTEGTQCYAGIDREEYLSVEKTS